MRYEFIAGSTSLSGGRFLREKFGVLTGKNEHVYQITERVHQILEHVH